MQIAHDEAQRAVEQFRAERALALEAFASKAGWRVTIEASSPLRPRGFDPMNLDLLDDGKVLHHRYLALATEHVDVEVTGLAVLTEAAGRHPLLHGVRRLEIAGLDPPPPQRIRDGRTNITATGVDVRFASNAVTLSVARTGA